MVSFGVLVFWASTATEADAQRRYTGINQRQQNQERRIQNGANTGSLTKGEYQRLQAQQYRIEVREKYMRSTGGVFTARERARLQHSQNKASRNIYRQKHDRYGNPIP